MKKAQASFEFLSTYAWVLMAVTVTIGTLFYFNVFDPKRYLPEECEFGQNILCEDWSIQKASEFDMNIKLKNNLEKSIEPTDIAIYDNDFVSITCESYLYCPFDGTDINWTDDDMDGDFVIDGGGKWSPGMSCNLELLNCDKSVIQGAKQTFKISFTFRRHTDSHTATKHTVQGKVFSMIQ
ncbi:hypothetical protein HQ533_05510 [Candidatus Woesearchaeota archaeon]|nr:hypothetical protein [Candidatus Woesearchaeota archaeon]